MMALINDMKSEKDHPGQPKLVVSNNTKADGLVFAEKNLVETLSAKEVIVLLSEQINGTGGGRVDFAQGAGETDNLKDFVTSIPNSVKSLAK